MGVYIKGMKMPKNCNECPLHFYEGQGICCCRALPAIDDGEILKPWKNKRKDCPLIPVPPHGDLTDRNETIKALWKALFEYEDKTEKLFVESSELDVANWILHRIFVQDMSDIDRQTILQMPTIIPADEVVYISNDINCPCNIKKCTAETIESCCGCPEWFKWKHNIEQKAYVGKHPSRSEEDKT